MFEIGSDKWPGISKLIEECGEVLQACGKLMGAQGEVEHWDGSNLRDVLTEEMGDVLAALQFVTAYCDFDPRKIAARADFKLALFEKWHREQTHPRRKNSTPPSEVALRVFHGRANVSHLPECRFVDDVEPNCASGCPLSGAPREPIAANEEELPCTGTLVHDEFTACPRHDR